MGRTQIRILRKEIESTQSSPRRPLTVAARGRTDGFTLASTMAVIGVMVILSSLVVSLLVTLANFGRLSDNGEKAQDMARAVVTTAIAHLNEDPNWGEDSTTRIELKEEDGWPGTAYVSFSAPEAKFRSVHNMAADSALVRGGLGHFVPARSVQIVGVAQVGQAQNIFEVVVQRKGLEYAIASSGELTMKGENEAAAFESLEDLEGLNFRHGVPKADLLDGKQRKTSVASLQAMKLEKQLTLYGDAVSTAEIEGAEANVIFKAGGKSKPFTESSKVKLPELDAADYDPLRPGSGLGSNVVKRPTGSNFSNPTFTGFTYTAPSAGVRLTGDVKLDDAQLHVKGDCVVDGSLAGTGLLSVEGDLIIDGQANLEATSQLAIVVNGDIIFRGEGKSQSLFKGLIFSQGASELSNISVVGGVYANNPNDSEKATMELSDVTLIEQSETQTFDLKTEVGAPDYEVPGSVKRDLERKGITIINPKTSEYIDPRTGIYNNKPISFGVNVAGRAYPTVDQAIASVSNAEIRRSLVGLKTIASATWTNELKNIKPGDYKEVPIFQFDPNTILNEASQWKVVSPGRMSRG